MCAIQSAQFAGLPDRNQISTIIFQLKLGCDVRRVAVCAGTIGDRFEHSIRKQVSIDKEFRRARGLASGFVPSNHCSPPQAATVSLLLLLSVQGRIC